MDQGRDRKRSSQEDYLLLNTNDTREGLEDIRQMATGIWISLTIRSKLG